MHEEQTSVFLITNQQEDTFLRTSAGNGMVARLLSMRCLDAYLEALPSQDYASVVSKHGGASLCFCVCDGVSSSSNGDLAARYLANGLVEWLQELPDIHDDPQRLVGRLCIRLEHWAQKAQRELTHVNLPSEATASLRRLIEEERTTRGSETVFLGGRIDHEDTDASASGSHRVYALFCWMGNVTGHLSTTADEAITLGEPGNDTNRWSTVHGRCGSLTFIALTLERIERLIIHTDGLDGIEQELPSLNDQDLLARTEHLRHLPKNDDMTVLDLAWRNPSSAEEEVW